MSARLGQPVVENRPGAAGSIAAAQLAKSVPDGYRLLMLASSTFIHAVLTANTSYSLERDFTPISLVTVSPLILVVHPSVPVRSVSEVVALARSRPGKLNLGYDGVGGTSHLAGELFTREAVMKQGLEVQTTSPEQFVAFTRELGAQITRLGKVANIKME